MKTTYPPISEASLVPFRAIMLLFAQNGDLLDRPECPYNEEIKSFLRDHLLSRTKGPTSAAPAEKHSYDADGLVEEISELYRDLKNTDVKGDPKDQISLLKTRADLLTKMVGLQEKALNIRDYSSFQRAVIEVLENIVSPAQRSEFIEKLGQYIQ